MCPRCPADLAHVRKDWNHYGRILAGLGILRDTDAIAWEALWRTFAKYMKLTATAKAGRLNPEGNPAGLMLDPFLSIELQYLNTLLRLLDRFGMSPSSRGALNIEAPKEADDFTKFLQRKKA
jgi:phage terminase small subunit